MGLQDMVRQMMTESDNRTHDIFRYLSLLCILVGLGLEVYVVVVKEPSQPYDFMNFGTGVGLILGGAAVALKLKTETKQTAFNALKEAEVIDAASKVPPTPPAIG